MRRWICILAALALLCLPAGAEELPAELTDALPSQAERLLVYSWVLFARSKNGA